MADPVAAIDEGAIEIIDPGGAKWVHYVKLVWENTLPLIVVLLIASPRLDSRRNWRLSSPMSML